ncbi:MAG: TIGR00300 family protein [Caulobacteraceae bacterium]
MEKDKKCTNQVILKEAIMDKHVPDDFYSTTNHITMVFWKEQWFTVENQRMDAMIVVEENRAYCKKLREIKKGDWVVCGDTGIRTIRPHEEESGNSFGFMNNCVSSERRNEIIIKNLAEKLYNGNKKAVIVLGPVVVHTGGDIYLRELIRNGYVSCILAGNAVAVHDIEKSLYGTSLGVCAKSGRLAYNGYRNHMRAINQVMKYGSIKEMVNAGALNSGIMYECIKGEVPFVLAGSLRDDGPLPDTVTDMIEAQNAYAKQLKAADIVIVLGSMLHGIATGNMLPAKVEMVCVDINPAVVTKLSDRGSSQAAGIVTDVGLFLNLLVKELTDKVLPSAI